MTDTPGPDRQGDVPVPAVPHLILVQSQGLLETLLDGPPGPSHPHQFLQGRSGRAEAYEVRANSPGWAMLRRASSSSPCPVSRGLFPRRPNRRPVAPWPHRPHCIWSKPTRQPAKPVSPHLTQALVRQNPQLLVAPDGQHVGNSRSLQPPPQLAVVAIDLISSNPAEAGIPAPASALAGPVAAWSESRHSPAPQPPAAAPSLPPTPTGRYNSRSSRVLPLALDRPEKRQSQFSMSRTAADRLLPFLEESGLVHHQHRVSGGQMLHHDFRSSRTRASHR